jgi:integrase
MPFFEFTRLKDGDGKWMVNLMVDGQRIHRLIGRESEGVTLTQAIQYLEQVKTDARHGRLNLPKGRKIALGFSKAADKYIEHLKAEGGKEIEKKEQRFNLHLKDHFGNMPLSKINAFEIEKYKKQRKDKGAKPGTINRELAVVSHMLSKAEEWGWLDKKPCKVKFLKEDNTRLVYLSEAQSARLLEAAKEDENPQIYLFVLIALFTGMRRSEILTLKLENIHTEHCQIYLPKAKAGARTQPITKTLSDYLAHHIGSLPKAQIWLFPSIGKTKSKYGHTTAIEEPFRRIVKAAGMDPKQITPHTLRHTATTHLVQAGVDIPTIQSITGHKTVEMVLRYSHQSGNHIQQAYDKLETKYNFESLIPITHRLPTGQKTQKTRKRENVTGQELEYREEWYPQGNSNPCRLREREVS